MITFIVGMVAGAGLTLSVFCFKDAYRAYRAMQIIEKSREDDRGSAD